MPSDDQRSVAVRYLPDDRPEVIDLMSVAVALSSRGRIGIAVTTCVPEDETTSRPGNRAGAMNHEISCCAEPVTEQDRLPLPLLTSPQGHSIAPDLELTALDSRVIHPSTSLALSITTVSVGFSSGPPSLPISSTTEKPLETLPTTA